MSEQKYILMKNLNNSCLYEDAEFEENVLPNLKYFLNRRKKAAVDFFNNIGGIEEFEKENEQIKQLLGI